VGVPTKTETSVTDCKLISLYVPYKAHLYTPTLQCHPLMQPIHPSTVRVCDMTDTAD
jgi:hypothetical protein